MKLFTYISSQLIFASLITSICFAQNVNSFTFARKCSISFTKHTPLVLKNRFLDNKKVCWYQYDNYTNPLSPDFMMTIPPNQDDVQDVITFNTSTYHNFNKPYPALYSSGSSPIPITISGGRCTVVEGYPQTTMQTYGGVTSQVTPIYVKTNYLYNCYYTK